MKRLKLIHIPMLTCAFLFNLASVRAQVKDIALNRTQKQGGLIVTLRKVTLIPRRNGEMSVGFTFKVTNKNGKPCAKLKNVRVYIKELRAYTYPGTGEPQFIEPTILRPALLGISPNAVDKIHTIMLEFREGNPSPSCAWKNIGVVKYDQTFPSKYLYHGKTSAAQLTNVAFGSSTSLLGDRAISVVRATVWEKSFVPGLVGDGMVIASGRGLVPLSCTVQRQGAFAKYVSTLQIQNGVGSSVRVDVKYYSSAEVHKSLKEYRFRFANINLKR